MNLVEKLSYLIIGFGGCLMFLSVTSFEYGLVINSIIAIITAIGLCIAIKELRVWKKEMNGRIIEQLYEKVLLWGYRLRDRIEVATIMTGGKKKDIFEILKDQLAEIKKTLRSEKVKIARFRARALQQSRLAELIDSFVSDTSKIERAVIIVMVLAPMLKDDPGLEENIKSSRETIANLLKKGGLASKMDKTINEIEEEYRKFLNS